jgi:predicted 3-demethylubiquinone-9 3-methyltransferase (glyoxalase superfamily)
MRILGLGTNDALAAGGAEAKRAFVAMMTMTKIDIARCLRP